RRTADHDPASGDRAPRPAVRRPHILALRPALRDLALHHRVLPRRRPRRDRRPVPLPVHLGRALPDRHRHALPAAPAPRRGGARPAGALRPSTIAPAAVDATHRLQVGPDDDGKRLDVYVAECVPALSRSQAQRLIRTGHVRVNGAEARPSTPLVAGCIVEVDVPPPEPDTPEPEALPLTIRYEDDDLAVIEKPAGMVVHPGAGHASGTLVNALLFHLSGLSGIGGKARPGIVHRLDRGTSGLMVVAKHDAAHQALARQFAGRRVEKLYTALVWGRPEKGAVFDRPIGRDPVHRQKMSTRAPKGRAALTRIVDVEPLGPLSLVTVAIESGRTHQ